jgi:hypothetical protein
LFFRQLKEVHHGLIDLENSEFAVINAEGIGDAVKNPAENLFVVGSHICLPFPEALKLVSSRHTDRELVRTRNKDRWRQITTEMNIHCAETGGSREKPNSHTGVY